MPKKRKSKFTKIKGNKNTKKLPNIEASIEADTIIHIENVHIEDEHIENGHIEDGHIDDQEDEIQSDASSASTTSTSSSKSIGRKRKRRTHLTSQKHHKADGRKTILQVVTSEGIVPFSIIFGTRHQADDRFSSESRGKQCTAVAVVALVHTTFLQPNEWTSCVIDNILDLGDDLYRHSMQIRTRQGTHVAVAHDEYLEMNEVQSKFTFNNQYFEILFDERISISGNLKIHIDDNFPILSSGLFKLFRIYTMAVFTCNYISVALFKHNNHLYIFDSHARNSEGLGASNGKACLMRFGDRQSLNEHLIRSICPNADRQYTLCPINIRVGALNSNEYVQLGPNEVHHATPPFVIPAARPAKRTPAPATVNMTRNKTIPLAAIGQPLPQCFHLGQLNKRCHCCDALFFTNELHFCCKTGAIKVPFNPDAAYPEVLKTLLQGGHTQSKQFITNIRRYNTLLAFASTQANVERFVGSGPPVYVISGQIYHYIADVSATGNRFGSLYFIDTGEATDRRRASLIQEGCSRELLEEIDILLRRINPYARLYCSLRELVDEKQRRGEVIQHVGLYFDRNPVWNYAAPTVNNEIGAVFSSTDGQVPPRGKIMVYVRSQGETIQMKQIENPSPIVDALCYPLLFPHGERGWSIDMPATSNRKRQRVSMNEFEKYRIMQRQNVFNPILNAGKLTQQFMVDKYAIIEGDRLHYLKTNQNRLRVDSYEGLQDYVANKAINRDQRVGRIAILPSTFTGGPRFMQSNYQDAMAIVCKYGKPTLFVTMTCNPQWEEFKQNIPANCNTMDRPDLIARVFELKRKELFDDLLKRKIFGEIVAWVYVIEFQKRGLPHAHCLLTLSNEDKLREPEDVDRFISAELPDQEGDYKRVYDIVTKAMIHGPCGDLNPDASCMEDGKCTKKFPKDFAETTQLDPGRYPVYRRRNDGKFLIRNVANKQLPVDNTNVVPYNPYLCAKYNCHINVEVCAMVAACKYLFYYINKGPDAALMTVRDELVYDEVQQYIDSRYISASEAAWRILQIPTQGKSHTVCRLPVHLPGQRTVYFDEGEEAEAIQEGDGKFSRLEAFFNLNRQQECARRYPYAEIPLHYRFDNNKWIKRRQKANIITRIYTISPRYSEQFHLRILLLHVPGPKSFDELLTVDGHTCDTFREAAERRFLIETDDEWTTVMSHAKLVTMPGAMRKLFAYLLCFCTVSNPQALWNAFKTDMCEDLIRRYKCPVEEAERRALIHIGKILQYASRTLEEFGFTMPEDNAEFDFADVEDVLEEIEATADVSLLNEQQLFIFNKIISAIDSPQETDRYFFIQGSGGTGKTFLYNTVISHLAARGVPVMAVAFTGIAALLLTGGRTVHSAFKLPLNMFNDSTSLLTVQSEEAETLRRLQLIIWDEISMTSHYIINCVDRLLKYIKNNERPFGGTCMLLGGDVKQLLSIASGRVRQMEQLFANCDSWECFKVFNLTVNMRTGPEHTFADWLLRLGTGQLNEPPMSNLPADVVLIPPICLTNDVVEDIYGDIIDAPQSTETTKIMAGRAILCPKNDHCDTVNGRLIERFAGELVTVLSNDSVMTNDEDEIANFPEEYLNTITPSGMPPHILKFKIGVPVILLRNLSIQDGLINGTRLIVLNVTQFLLFAEIVTGRFSGKKVLIPRMDLTSSDNRFPFVLKRRQFPVKICFALTINKAQGQTFEKVGIYLESPVFSHGQLYVAFSRARNWQSVKVQVRNSKLQGALVKNSRAVYTKNIVFENVFRILSP